MSSRKVGRCAGPPNGFRCRRQRRVGGRVATAARESVGWLIAARARIRAPIRRRREPSAGSSRFGCCAAGDRIASPICGGLHPSTVHRVLTRYRLAKLRWLDGSTGHVVRRMEPAACGDIVHIDVKKLGKIPAGGGWRMLGRTAGNHNSWADKVLAGAASAATRWVVIIFSIPLLMATRAWLTASCLATSARRLPPRSGSGQIPGSPNVA